jgi:hypothetical protein
VPRRGAKGLRCSPRPAAAPVCCRGHSGSCGEGLRPEKRPDGEPREECIELPRSPSFRCSSKRSDEAGVELTVARPPLPGAGVAQWPRSPLDVDRPSVRLLAEDPLAAQHSLVGETAVPLDGGDEFGNALSEIRSQHGSGLSSSLTSRAHRWSRRALPFNSPVAHFHRFVQSNHWKRRTRSPISCARHESPGQWTHRLTNRSFTPWVRM